MKENVAISRHVVLNRKRDALRVSYHRHASKVVEI
jgi:hypothetical protein